jgi:hypothetical protein
VIYERYDALAVFEALRNGVPARLQAISTRPGASK